MSDTRILRRLGSIAASLAVLLAAGCSAPGNDASNAAPATTETAVLAAPAAGNASTPANTSAAGELSAAELARLPEVLPPEPGTPGGLRDERTPASEAPFAETSAQGAANVVQTYFAHLEAGQFAEAWKLWSDGGKASGMEQADFAASFAKYHQFHALVGAPGEIEGAAGSLYVEVPVVVYGRLKTGREVHMKGPLTLSRVNDVPGSTAEQRKWHIRQSGLESRPVT
jgi:hypothetical protein